MRMTNSGPSVLVITRAQDSHADLVEGVLRQKGCSFIRFDPSERDTTFSILTDRTGAAIELRVNGCAVALDGVRTVWFRQPGITRGHSGGDPAGLWAFLEVLSGSLQDRLWINPYRRYLTARCKPYQLRVAQDVGLLIPPSLVSSVADEVLDFSRTFGGDVILKAFESSMAVLEGRALFTSRVSTADVERHMDSIALSTCLLQRRLVKVSELRITYICGLMFVAEAVSRSGDLLPTDRRRRLHEVLWRRAELDDATADKLRHLMQRLGLEFGCIDMAKTVDNELVFLEVNPSGQWYWIEHDTNQPLLAALVSAVIGGRS